MKRDFQKKNHPNRKLAEHRLNVQINLVDGFKGQTIFIPGNHDYYSNGIKGLKRQEDYIIEQLGKMHFYQRAVVHLKKLISLTILF